MDVQQGESGEVINKRLSEVKEDKTDRSKHRSTASETDCFISETSISEAVVKTVSNESFAVLEAGSTVKLSLPSTENLPKDDNDSQKTQQSANGEIIQDENSPCDKKTHASISADTASAQEPSTAVVKTNEDASTVKYQSSGADNSLQQGSVPNNSVVIETDQNTNKNHTISEELEGKDKIDSNNTQEQLKHAEKLTRNKLSGISENSGDTISSSVNTQREVKNVLNDQSNETVEKVKKEPPSENPGVHEQTTEGKSDGENVTDEPTKTNINNEKQVSGENGTADGATDKTSNSTSEVAKSELQVETSQFSSESQENNQNENASPEEIALLAQKLTTSLAKQMVNSTSAMASQMIEASTNALTLYNGSTLELADIDYFVIYKAENPISSDGISFIARMELGTHCLTRVMPVGPTRAWVGYSGGGIKLIDTESQSAINKIDIQGLDNIATSEESFLFTTTIKTFSVVDRTHIVGEGVSGSAPMIRVCKNRIACFAIANSGKNIMVCVEKQHSCLCIPGKSEIVVQIYEMNGKRGKELKPKINGRQTQTKGFPIVMCENSSNKDICIASYNSSDHTCAVEVYDKNMERRFVYDGDKTLSPRFMCEDICSDKTGNILMLDNSLKSIHIVNSTGKLVKLISTPKYQIENPKCINIDINGRLWVGQGPPAQMIILEYKL